MVLSETTYIGAPITIVKIPAALNAGCYLYAFGSEGRYIKFGISKNLRARIATLSIGHPTEMKLLGFIFMPDRDYAREMEKRVHNALAPFHARGEWFKSCPKTMALAEMMGRLDGAKFDSIVQAWFNDTEQRREGHIASPYRDIANAWFNQPDSAVPKSI